MRHFILTLLLVGFALSTGAQTPKAYTGLNFVVEEEEETLTNNDETLTEQEISKEITPENVDSKESEDLKTPQININNEVIQENTEQEEEEPEEDNDESKKIFLALNDISTTLANVRAVSYCSGAFVLFNNTKRNILEVSGKITIGNQTKPFKFTNVAPGSSIGWPIQIVGTACESITKLPVLDITNCRAEKMSDKKCRAQLRYIPIGAK